MKRKHGLILVLILVLLLAGALPANAQDVVNISIDNLNFADFPRSQAFVTVRNENGVPIVGLGPEHFEIVEDGKASFPPTEVTTQVNPAAVTSVVMVIDISGSVKGKPIKEAMAAANALLDQLAAEDRAALIAFADEVADLDPANLEEGKEVSFTTDKNAIRNVVNFLDAKIGWDTPLYDAIYKGVKLASSEPVGKRAVIVMTDGRDERDNAQGVAVKDAGSLSTPDDPIHEANRYNIPIFPIGLVGLGGKIDTKYLARLAERTGGVYQEAPQPEELTPLFENVLAQLKHQYVLTYESTLPKDANYHSLLIRVRLPQGQAWAETKFRILEPEAVDPEPLSPAGGSSDTGSTGDSTTVAQVGTGDASTPAQAPTPEPESSGLQGIIDTVEDTIRDRPELAIIIGAGILLLIILIIALVIVLLRGRKAPEDEYGSDVFGDTYAPPAPDWQSEPIGPPTPAMDAPIEGKTEVAPGGWPDAGPAAPPFAPPPAPAQPAAQPPAGAAVPPAGGTRVIERAPKHLAMLVDKSQPDRKFDLKGTINVGRAQDNQIVLDDPTVSRHHAWIKSEGEDFMVFDVGSGNGTFVNDEKVSEPRRLENGDEVRFGEAKFAFTKVF